MTLNKLKKYKMGELIEPTNERNTESLFGVKDVRGMTIEKTIIPTKANMTGTDITNFLVVHPNEFIYNPRTHGKKIGLGFNDTETSFLISWNNIAFRIRKNAQDIIIPKYLYINFRRPEWDRKACCDSWGTSTEVFSWDSLCDMDITIPSPLIQQKYVDIYDAMVANQKAYEQGLDDLKLTCDVYLDKLKKECKKERIGKYIEQSDLRNEDKKLTLDNVKGISIEKKFIETKADMTGVSLKPYYVVKPNYFAYVPVTSRNGDKITLALNQTDETYIVSSSYIVFKVNDELKLDPHYLMMFFEQSDFDRYARFNSWGSARESFDWNEMQEVKIPIPDIRIQKSIANIYRVYKQRKSINEKLKAQIKDICPILIKGSLGAGNTNEK